MAHAKRFDHVGITVSDLDRAIAFFGALGLEVEGRQHIEGEFLDTVIGIPGSRTEIAMLTMPDGPTVLGLRNICFEVDDIDAVVERAAADGYGLVGEIGQYEDVWRMAYVRGPDGLIVSVAEAIG